MYHNTYPTSWLVSSQLTKTPFLFTYGDFSLLTVDHLTAFMPLPQQQALYATPQVTFDVPTMKRIPVNTLMQGVETGNSYVPFFRRRNVNLPSLDRQFSKESLAESSHGDSGVSSSRSSTPSSIETSGSNELKNRVSPTYSSTTTNATRSRRNFEHPRRFQHSQRQSQSNQRSPHFSIPKRFLKYDKDEWYNCSMDIWEHYIKTRQREDMYTKKMELRNALFAIFTTLFPTCGLKVVGSSVNGLGTNNSDVDMCLVLSPSEIDQQTDAMNILKYTQRVLIHCPFVKTTDLITAKVPILKFTDKYHNIQVDLNINNTVGIANTQLLAAYSKADGRVPPLVLVIKKWAQDCKINNAKEMTLSSYSLVLMVVHYLQCGCDPPVLPCLHRTQPRRYEGDWKWLIPYDAEANFYSKNVQSLGSLLNGFFDYYTNAFDFSKDAISVRLGCKLPKQVAMNYRSTKNKRGHWKFICIEEPFNRTNTACAVYDEDSFNRITCAFKSTWLKLNQKKELQSVLSS